MSFSTTVKLIPWKKNFGDLLLARILILIARIIEHWKNQSFATLGHYGLVYLRSKLWVFDDVLHLIYHTCVPLLQIIKIVNSQSNLHLLGPPTTAK